MEEQGDLRCGEDGTEGSAVLPPRRPVARTQAPFVPAPWRMWAAYGRMQASCGGEGTPWALPGRERAPGTRESTRENAQPWPAWLQWPPQAPAVGPGPAHLGPGSPQVNAFCGYQGPQAADPFTGRGGSSSVEPRSHPTQSLLAKFSPDFREYKRLGADLPPRGRVGSFEPRKTLSPPAGHRPETPRETGSLGVGPASPGPPHLARNRGRPLFQASGPWFFPGTLPLAGWETGWQVGSTGKGSDLWVAGRASRSTDTTPGTL